MRMKELRVGAEIRGEIPPSPERQDERLEPPQCKRDDEDDRDAPPCLGNRDRAPGEPRRDLADGAHDGSG